VEANGAYEAAIKAAPNAIHPWAGTNQYDTLKPATLYNAMICPVAPFAIRGILWYQGESNVGEGMRYAEKMKALISGWRRIFKEGDIPFYYVELPPWNYGSQGSLPEMWEAQESCLSVPNTGMAVIVDAGNIDGIHPENKRPVGERLALIALAKTHGRTDVECSGPIYKDMKIQNGAAVISFDHAGGGLMTKDGKPPAWFAIAGPDHKFVPAQATISGDIVIVKGDAVKDPVAVRYAWDNLAAPNLFNKSGLPARPFRTDG
jgi:sialate O-acetylesterase